MPTDLTAFAADIYRFSPDSVDQQAGSLPAYTEHLRRAREVVLFWE
jgi:hypothetical protein